MATHQFNRMHNDIYNSGTIDSPVPLGNQLDVSSRVMGAFAGLCATIVVTTENEIYATCITARTVYLAAFKPHTLDIIAVHSLPPRRFPPLKGDTSGGVYFYLNKAEQPVILNAANHLQIFDLVTEDNHAEWQVVADYDLNPYLPEGVLTQSSVIPDWNGNIWFIAQQGITGYLNPNTGAVQTLILPDEEQIQNDLAVDQEGVYLVSDQALYQMRINAETGQPIISWRVAYERGILKPSKVSLGSGTTPTLFGNGLIAIGDNASPQMNVLVFKRKADIAGDRLVCSVPVFTPDASTTEGSFAAYGQSLVLINTYGYEVPRGDLRDVTSGVVRIDIQDDLQACNIVWESDVTSVAPPRISTASGLIYLYTQALNVPRSVQAWYLTTLNFETGETVFEQYLGSGPAWNNVMTNYQMSPDGTIYLGTLNGIIAFREVQQ